MTLLILMALLTVCECQGQSEGESSSADSKQGFQGSGGPAAMPEIVRSVRPEYPDSLRTLGIEGKVWVSIQLDPDARVVGTAVQRSSGYPNLDTLALLAAKEYRFRWTYSQPPHQSCWVSVAMKFPPDSSTAILDSSSALQTSDTGSAVWRN